MMMIFHIKLWIFFFIFIKAVDVQYSFAQSYMINLPAPLKNSQTSEQVQSFYLQVYQDIGITPVFVFMPTKRAFTYFSKNLIQAEAYRNESIAQKHQLTTRISPAITQVKVALFCAYKSSCKIDENFDYVVHEGFKYGEKICLQLGLKCENIKSTFVLNKMLENKVVDAALYPYPAYKNPLCQSSKTQLFYHELPEFSFDIFHYINSSEEGFIEKLSNSIERNLALKKNYFISFNGRPNLDGCGKYLNRVN